MSTSYLDDIWNVHFHDPFEKDWTLKSYHRLMTLSTCDDFWDLVEAIDDKIVDGMFFVMREHVFPCWDDPENKDGGCFSIKVSKSTARVYWESLCAAVMGESLFDDLLASKCVNGVSISPKRSFCIIKIWMSKDGESLKVRDMKGLPAGHVGEILYKSWQFDS